MPDNKELTYRNILEWVYTKDGVYASKAEWREEFIKMLRFNILNKR